MTIISIVKDNKMMYGSPEKLAPYLNLTGQAVRLWINAGKQIESKNGYIVYLNCERIK